MNNEIAALTPTTRLEHDLDQNPRPHAHLIAYKLLTSFMRLIYESVFIKINQFQNVTVICLKHLSKLEGENGSSLDLIVNLLNEFAGNPSLHSKFVSQFVSPIINSIRKRQTSKKLQSNDANSKLVNELNRVIRSPPLHSEFVSLLVSGLVVSIGGLPTLQSAAPNSETSEEWLQIQAARKARSPSL